MSKNHTRGLAVAGRNSGTPAWSSGDRRGYTLAEIRQAALYRQDGDVDGILSIAIPYAARAGISRAEAVAYLRVETDATEARAEDAAEKARRAVWLET
jgi:hypothetical protein